MRHQIKSTIVSVILLITLFSTTALQAEQFLQTDPTDSLTAEVPNKKDSAKTDKAAKAEAALIGKWENPYFVLESGTNGQDTNGRSLKYQFREDGTYTKVLGGAEAQIEENGTWEISEDGAQVLMRSRSICDGQMATNTATIKHLSFNELVLEQTMCVSGVMVSSEPQEFYFNKF